MIAGQTSFPKETAFFGRSRPLILCLLFVAAFSIRLYHIDEPPLDFHATRQYRSLIIARGYYFETLESLPEWKMEVASINKQRQGILEPPIMESIVALAYRVVGGEHFWIPRSMSSIFWLIGGWFLYRIAKRISTDDAAVFALAFYLFLPFSVVASRSFQPDPLMIMMLLLSILAILRYDERPTIFRLIVAAAISALACFIKPVSLFVILGAFTSVAIYRQGIVRSVLGTRLLLFAVVALLPTITFYFYGIFVAGFLRGQAQASFLPQFLLHPLFWRSWVNNTGAVVGFAALVTALLGTLMLRGGLPLALTTGLWAGYVAFSLVFDYHVATHDYYHLQLIPIVALGLGPVFALVIRHLNQIYERRPLRVAVWLALTLAMVLDIGAVRPLLESPSSAEELTIAREVGQIVEHSTKTVFLSGSYGLPLEYHGEISGEPWPIKSDLEWEKLAGATTLSARERFIASYSEYAPEYFIIQDLREFEGQEDLNAFLFENYSVVRNDNYLVFNLRKPVAGGR